MKIIDGIKTYGTEGEAFRRVDSLKHNEGIWSAIVKCGNRWRLFHDPDNQQARGPRVQVKADKEEEPQIPVTQLEPFDEEYKEWMRDLEYERTMRNRKEAEFAHIEEVA